MERREAVWTRIFSKSLFDLNLTSNRYPEYVLQHVHLIPTKEPQKSLKAAILLYTSFLIKMHNMSSRTLEKEGTLLNISMYMYSMNCFVGRSSTWGRVCPSGSERAAAVQVHWEAGRDGQGREDTPHPLSTNEGQDSSPSLCPCADPGRLHGWLPSLTAGPQAHYDQVRQALAI